MDVLAIGGLCRDGGAALRARCAWEEGVMGCWARRWGCGGASRWRTSLPSGCSGPEAPRLEELRLQAQESRVEADLRLGRHAELVPSCESLTARHPLREPVPRPADARADRCGRQAEALAAYQRARHVLVDELGTEPGAGLQELHQRILAADPALAVPAAAPPAAGSRPRAGRTAGAAGRGGGISPAGRPSWPR